MVRSLTKTLAFTKDIKVSSCPTLVQIDIKNNVRSVHKKIGSENPPSSQANKPSPVDFPEEFESGESASSIAVEECCSQAHFSKLNKLYLNLRKGIPLYMWNLVKWTISLQVLSSYKKGMILLRLKPAQLNQIPLSGDLSCTPLGKKCSRRVSP